MKAATLLCLLALAACAAPPPEAYVPPGSHVRVEPLGEGVYAAIRTEPLGMAVNSNSLFIVNEADVVVVDAQFTRAATLENLAALRRITLKPVALVLNTHWHDDHLAGNQVYQDSFPGVAFLATAATRADLVALGRPNRAQQLATMPRAATYLSGNLARGLAPDGSPVTAGERAALESALAIVGQYLADTTGYREVLPDSIAGSRVTLVRGQRRIDLYSFGPGNTRGDLVVHLPREHIVAVGDLAGAPVPFGFNSYPTQWLAVLDSVIALQPGRVVMGHGPVMHGTEYLRVVRAALAEGRGQAEAAAASGAAASAITMETARARLAGSDPWLSRAFETFFRAPVASRLLAELQR